jgi:hypothetical protein
VVPRRSRTSLGIVIMEMFYTTFGFVGAVVLGIVILTTFFKVVGLLQIKMGAPALIKMKGFLKDAAWINVHLAGGKVLERVRFVGFTDHSSAKGGRIPYQLANMVVLETSAGKRILLRSDAVKMIEEIE